MIHFHEFWSFKRLDGFYGVEVGISDPLFISLNFTVIFVGMQIYDVIRMKGNQIYSTLEII